MRMVNFFLRVFPPCLVFGVMLCLVGSLLFAGGEETKQPPTPVELEKKISEIKERIRISELAENEQSALQHGVTLAYMRERTFKLRDIQSAVERLLTALKKKDALETEETHLRENLKAKAQIGISQKPPFTLSFYDSLLDKLFVLQQQMETVRLAAKLSQRTLEDGKLRLENTQKEWRLLQEAVGGIPENERTSELKWTLENAQLDMKLAGYLVSFEEVNRDNHLKRVLLTELQTNLLQKELHWIRSRLHFDKDDLDRRLLDIEHRETALQALLQKLIQGHKETEQAWLNAQRQVKSAVGQTPDPSTEAYLKEREAWHRTYQMVLEQTEDMLRLLGQQKQHWAFRYALVKEKMDEEQLVDQFEEAKNHLRNIQQTHNLQQRYQVNFQAQMRALEKEQLEGAIDPKVKIHLNNRMRAMRRLNERKIEYIAALLTAEELTQRVLDEINTKLEPDSASETLESVKSGFKIIWDYEVWVIDNQPITTSKLFVSLLILIFGILFIKIVVRTVSKRILHFAQLKESTAKTLEKIVLYVGYLMIVMFALRIVNIPLGTFAFLGGAIAIGIGFGAQKLINNFISGFIIMGERPISIGDLVEVEGILGRVEEIGARSTHIRTGENINILVPNSSFLEKNIINWTLTDRKVRAFVSVGVTYGSPVKEVERLLLKAADDNKKVFKAPHPFVLFSDFGDNALMFEIHFWISVLKIVERRLIESSIRFHIDELFREAGIVIAFPQRDIHMDTLHPLELRILKDEDEGETSK